MGGLYIEHNDRLHSLDALSSLGSAQGGAGDIHVVANPLLTDMAGLEGVSNANAVVVAENAALECLDGLENLKHLDDRLVLEQNASLQNADALLDINSLSQLRVIDNPELPSCYADTIAAAVEDSGYVTIEGNGDGACP